MYVLGVSKKHNNNGKRRHFLPKNKHRRLYYLDDEGRFHTKTISFGQGILIRLTNRKVKIKYDK